MELTGEKEIYVYLHKYFVFLLKAGGQRVIESVLDGPPQVKGHTLSCIQNLFKHLVLLCQVMASPQPTRTQSSSSQSHDQEPGSHDQGMGSLSREELLECLDKPLTSREFNVVRGTSLTDN